MPVLVRYASLVVMERVIDTEDLNEAADQIEFDGEDVDIESRKVVSGLKHVVEVQDYDFIWEVTHV